MNRGAAVDNYGICPFLFKSRTSREFFLPSRTGKNPQTEREQDLFCVKTEKGEVLL
jgi:hypothetical protein